MSFKMFQKLKIHHWFGLDEHEPGCQGEEHRQAEEENLQHQQPRSNAGVSSSIGPPMSHHISNWTN